MEIKRTVDSLGRTTDIITLTDEENTVVDAAQETIIQRCLAAGNAPSTEDREFTEWTLLGILRDEGIKGVQRFAESCQAASPAIPTARGYV